MHYSLKSSLTRYQRVELMALKESKSSQSPPLCQNDPKIIRLNILKNEPNHQEASGDQLKALSDELPNLPMSSIDSKIMDVLKSYQILKPQSNNGEFNTFSCLMFNFNFVHLQIMMSNKNQRKTMIRITADTFLGGMRKMFWKVNNMRTSKILIFQLSI